MTSYFMGVYQRIPYGIFWLEPLQAERSTFKSEATSMVERLCDGVRRVTDPLMSHVARVEGMLPPCLLGKECPKEIRLGWLARWGPRGWGWKGWLICGSGFVALFVVARSCVLLTRRVPMIRECVWSKLAQALGSPLNTDVRRRVQKNLNVSTIAVRQGHPHADAAGVRNGSTAAMHEMVRLLGRVPYVVSPSQREAGEDGCRYFYQLNDYVQAVKDDAVTDKHVLVMTDIDYYIDWSYWLSFGLPVLMYTFVPERCGGQLTEGVFGIKDDVVETICSGGGRYQHYLWNYQRDSAWVPVTPRSLFGKVLDFMGWLVGFWEHSQVIMFSIDQFQVGEDRRIISMVPYNRGPRFLWDDADTRLERMKITQSYPTGSVNIMRVLTKEGSKISVSQNGAFTSTTIPERSFDGVSIRYKMSSQKHVSDVQRMVKVSDDEAAILADVLSIACGVKPNVTIHGAGTSAPHYQVLRGSTVEDGKRYARRYAVGPLTEEAVYPVESHNNEALCLLKRIELPQKEANERIAKSSLRTSGTVGSRFASHAAEFVRLVVPVVGVGSPISVSEVHEVQSKPLQRARSERAKCWITENFVVRAFQKKEAYSEPNDPRNISGCPAVHTLRLSSYTLSFKQDCLKDCPWYVPGKTPQEIAELIMELASDNESLVEGDYSRFDGTITQWLRQNVEFACYLRWCRPDHVVELGKLLDAELDPRAVTKLGTRYSPGGSRLSGSPLTTDGNTLINAFVAFAVLREQKYDAAYAFRKCGIFYGDDSLITGRAVHPEKGLSDITRVASVVGLSLKAKHVLRGEPVSFLSRIFVDPWTSPSSLCDPPRALLKIHTTINNTDDIGKCGFSKATAYLVTDPVTPVVSEWCEAYLRCLGTEHTDMVNDDLPYWYVVPECRNSPWPQEDTSRFVELVAKSLGKTSEEIVAHTECLKAYTGPVDGIPRLETCVTRAKTESLVDGIRIRPGESTSVSSVPVTIVDNNSKTSQNRNGKEGRANCVESGAQGFASSRTPNNGGRNNDSRKGKGVQTSTSGPSKSAVGHHQHGNGHAQSDGTVRQQHNVHGQQSAGRRTGAGRDGTSGASARGVDGNPVGSGTIPRPGGGGGDHHRGGSPGAGSTGGGGTQPSGGGSGDGRGGVSPSSGRT